MSITFTGSDGALFDRFGRFVGAIQDFIAFCGGTATARVLGTSSLVTRGTNLEADAAASPAISGSIDGHWTALEQFQTNNTLATGLRTLAEGAFIDQVHLDAPLATKDITSALAEVRRQMVVGSASINGSSLTIGAQASVGTPTGTPFFVLSGLREDGLRYQTIFTEVLRIACTGDSYTGGQTARQETFSITGAERAPDVWDYRYPAGSGCSQEITLVDAQTDGASGATSGNLLVNGDFETASTANYFDNWVHGSGAAGTDFNANGSGYTGSNALEVRGGGVANPTIYQEFNKATSTSAGAGGTPVVLQPKTLYALAFFAKKETATAGVLRVALVDSSGNVLNDDAGNANSTTYTLSGWTTSFVAKSYVFRTPTILPTDGIVRLQLKLTTNLTNNTESVVIDDIALAPMTRLYTGGPAIAGFAGDTRPVVGDSFTVSVSNTRGVLVDYLERAFELASKDVILPYNDAAGETIADSVVR